MSRKDFELIADTIGGLDVDADLRREIAADFATALASTNSRFDRARFIAAATA
jgi:hypothetical protein